MAEKIGIPEALEVSPRAKTYVDLVPGEELLAVLANQFEKTVALIRKIGEQRASTFVYAPGKWTVKQILGHVTDTERIFAYRALRLARRDTTPLPGFEQDDYVASAGSNDRLLDDLISEWQAVRQSTLWFFRGVTGDCWMRQGTISEWSFTVRGIAFTIAGHELHHYKILQEQYL
jgi:DinB superfamily